MQLGSPSNSSSGITEYPWAVSIRTMMVIIVRARFQPSDWAVESGISRLLSGSGSIPARQSPRRTGAGRNHRSAAEAQAQRRDPLRSEEHTSELQSLMRISYAVFCLNK